MRLFAIGDLHLPGGDEKPMDVFGSHWDRHFLRISESWNQTVTENDLVLIPGDISWAMQLKDAIPDLNAIGALPGRKVLLKGNHDYWWSSLSRVRSALPEGMSVIQYDALIDEDFVICGARGWNIPTEENSLTPEDEKIYLREVQRLELSLQQAVRLAEGRRIVAMMHFPPLYDNLRDTAFTEMLEKYGVHTVVYGHLHAQGIRSGYSGEHHGIRYYLTSCDSLDFNVLEIPMT